MEFMGWSLTVVTLDEPAGWRVDLHFADRIKPIRTRNCVSGKVRASE